METVNGWPWQQDTERESASERVSERKIERGAARMWYIYIFFNFYGVDVDLSSVMRQLRLLSSPWDLTSPSPWPWNLASTTTSLCPLSLSLSLWPKTYWWLLPIVITGPLFLIFGSQCWIQFLIRFVVNPRHVHDHTSFTSGQASTLTLTSTSDSS